MEVVENKDDEEDKVVAHADVGPNAVDTNNRILHGILDKYLAGTVEGVDGKVTA